jgi:hypothetical protein
VGTKLNRNYIWGYTNKEGCVPLLYTTTAVTVCSVRLCSTAWHISSVFYNIICFTWNETVRKSLTLTQPKVGRYATLTFVERQTVSTDWIHSGTFWHPGFHFPWRRHFTFWSTECHLRKKIANELDQTWPNQCAMLYQRLFRYPRILQP